MNLEPLGLKPRVVQFLKKPGNHFTFARLLRFIPYEENNHDAIILQRNRIAGRQAQTGRKLRRLGRGTLGTRAAESSETGYHDIGSAAANPVGRRAPAYGILRRRKHRVRSAASARLQRT